MPASYEIDKQRRLVITTGLDPFTTADALAHQQKLLEDPDFNPSFSQIMDFTRIAAFELEAGDVRMLAQRTVFSPESRRAIVVSTNLGYGLSRMFEMHREGFGENGIRVFRDLDEAVDWILSKNATG
jgi:hypothetical protein